MPRGRLDEQVLIDRVSRAEPKLRRAAVNAIVAARDANTQTQLARLIRQNRIEDAIEAAGRAGAIALHDAHAAIYNASGASTSAWLSETLSISASFDQVHEFAVERMRFNRLRLVREWMAGQREVTREVLEDAIEQGLGPVAQARRFRAVTGLTAHQRRMVDRYRQALMRVSAGDTDALERRLRDKRFDRTVRRNASLRKPLTAKQIDRMVDRYRARWIKHRAEVIARTESHRAVMAGNRDAFRQAVDQRIVRADEVQQTWVTAIDGRERPEHNLADGQTVGIDDPFSVGGEALEYPGDPAGSAWNSINCRCSITMSVSTSEN